MLRCQQVAVQHPEFQRGVMLLQQEDLTVLGGQVYLRWCLAAHILKYVGAAPRLKEARI